MDAGSGLGWPIVARDDEFRQALTALDAGTDFRGVALLGASGVGKSTMARGLAAAVQARGHRVRYVLGTETGRSVPLGAFSRAVTVGGEIACEPVAMLAAAHATLDREESLVIVVDDAQLLDPISATLVYQLADGGNAQLIVTIDQADPAPDAVTSLLKERRLGIVHIEPFNREQTGQLARAVLGGCVESRLIDELFRRTAGNLLLLRGLLSAGRESEVLVHTPHGWQLRGPLHPDRVLFDLLAFRLRSLAPKELEAIEILAVGELLDWELLRGLCDADAVAALERRGLIQLVADGSDMLARLNHPVLGEAAIRLAGIVRTRTLNGILAQALRKHLQAGGRRSRLPDVRGQIRLAQLMMHSDLDTDLDVIIRAATNAMAVSAPGCGEELARFAFDRGGGIPAALALADALSWQGRGGEAETILAGVGTDDVDVLLLVRWGCLRSANLFWVCAEVERAQQVLAELKQRVDSEPGGALITALELSFAYFSGDVAPALESGPALCAPDVLPIATVWAAVPTACALALAGRFADVDGIAEAGLRAAALSDSGPHRFAIGVAEVLAATCSGDQPAAEQICRRYVAMAAGAPDADAMANTIRGLVDLAGGAVASACAAFRDSISAFSRGFPAPWMMLVAAWWAQAEGVRGDGAAAAAALRASEESYGPQVAVFLPELELARAWERAAVGETTAARAHSMRAASAARQLGMAAVEMRALHSGVRFGDRSPAGRLAELAGNLNTPLARAIELHARGLAGRDGGSLDAAADQFAEIGALALAADAAAQSAREHARASDRGREVAAANRAHQLAVQGGIRTPAIAAMAQPLPISDREREIVMLVAAGLSNRQIADRLSVSVRTVDGHLYRIFTKLDIEHRHQLVRLVHADPPAGRRLP